MPTNCGDGGTALQDCVDQTKLASLPDFGEGGGHVPHDFGSALLERPERSVKQEVRQQHGLSVQREERREVWRAVFLKRESAGAEANAGLYWETVKTCFGSEELPSSDVPLPPIVETKHANSFCLTAAGRRSVARILTCVAYNSPEIQYCPYSYPVAAVIRHYLSGKRPHTSMCRSLFNIRGPIIFQRRTRTASWSTWQAASDQISSPLPRCNTRSSGEPSWN